MKVIHRKNLDENKQNTMHRKDKLSSKCTLKCQRFTIQKSNTLWEFSPFELKLSCLSVSVKILSHPGQVYPEGISQGQLGLFLLPIQMASSVLFFSCLYLLPGGISSKRGEALGGNHL